ncbi:Uncharacterized protein OS=Rhodopirellula baltica SWK14 GN=RBSWK_01457 PE=4 SV=1 [Gemmata massiliana]|uniref:Uncharacterized protein n=1 Tax=Gemmata massiliana TaxID=1210884 RepID=A0A6P2CYY6_9BACT|nr:hypothetical protein [Gemmata massiliana]VTR94073.1 Uncharacterized protein OS=Rhodopirellula baltica SWK14 GN=RBSWK_01457 PE=4 SV=1 [Gemmata massiliana]
MSEAIAPNAENTPIAQWKMLGMSLGEWTQSLLTFILGGIATYAGGQWTKKESHLTVKTNETVKFQGDKVQYGIVNFSIKSDGSKEAESIECQFNLLNTQEVKATPASLNAVSTVKDSKVTITVPMLNPGETLQISAVTTNPASELSRSDISVRGKGVVGDSEPPRDYSNLILTIIVLIASMLLGAFLTNYYWKFAYNAGRRNALEEVSSDLVGLRDAARDLVSEVHARVGASKQSDPPTGGS